MQNIESERIGFVATRFVGNDGVSLESKKWAEILEEMGHQIFWYAGKLDRPRETSYCIPEAHFTHAENEWISERIWGNTCRGALITKRIRDMAEYLKGTLHSFIEHYDISILIFENTLSMPMNIPFGIAITELLNETEISAIAHHHDFYWERPRYAVTAVHDFLEMAFPPRDEELIHVVVNKKSRESLSWRKGISSTRIPYVLDFHTQSSELDDFNKDFRKELGFKEEDILFMQPTRVVPRKGIENAIRLISMLENPRCKLLITHDSGDEGYEYEYMLKGLAEYENVDIHFIGDYIAESRRFNQHGEKIFRLWDAYLHADFVTYPSIHEGFGNAFLETIYFKIPLLVNRYDTFMHEIEPKGFKTVSMDGYISQKVLDQTREVLINEELRNEMVSHNFELGKKYFSYQVLRHKLHNVIANLKGE